MELDQSAAIDDPKQTGTATTVERTMAAAAEQGQGIPIQCGGALCLTCPVSQNHSPADPNPLRTDRMPRDFFALLNSFACVMR
jgi:ferredoxin